MPTDSRYDKKLISLAKNLRKSMTKEERILWYDFLCRLPLHVRRQCPIEHYILDFYIEEKKLAIELDGSQHAKPANKEADVIRDETLNKLGITVLRFRNRDVKKYKDGVCNVILKHVGLKWENLLPKRQRAKGKNMLTANTELLYWQENKEWYKYNDEIEMYELTDSATERAKASFEMWKEFNGIKS